MVGPGLPDSVNLNDPRDVIGSTALIDGNNELCYTSLGAPNMGDNFKIHSLYFKHLSFKFWG